MFSLTLNAFEIYFTFVLDLLSNHFEIDFTNVLDASCYFNRFTKIYENIYKLLHNQEPVSLYVYLILFQLTSVYFNFLLRTAYPIFHYLTNRDVHLKIFTNSCITTTSWYEMRVDWDICVHERLQQGGDAADGD